MPKSLRKRLVLSYMLVTIICVFLISMLSNLFLERQFKNYVIQSHERKSEDVIRSVTEQYRGNNQWNGAVIERIGIDALENGLIISLIDSVGKKIWDANEHNYGMCEALIAHLSHNMRSRYPNWEGGYVKNEHPIVIDMNKVGVVTIGYYGPYYYSDHDIMFLNALNKIFMLVGIASLCIALMLGLLMAEGLSRPISRVISAAEGISRGNYKDRVKGKSDIAELNKLVTTINGLAEALENQELLRKRITGDVAHELRTPLATLQSHMEAIIDGIWEPTIDRIKSCHEEAVRINRLVGDLEKLAQYENDNLILHKDMFNISDVVNSILLNFGKEYMDKNIEVTFNRKEQLVYADRDKISQVIVNLVSNSLKYTPKGGKVDFSIGQDKGNVILSVRDTGVGIAEEDLPHIFERFYRADKSRNRMTGGAGIGLTITKSIVEAHGGSIIVESAPGMGTEFRVCLPADSQS
jgi:two-component system, OmpR family, sensor histidine kinase BaeS